jgi:hypothetical protein
MLKGAVGSAVDYPDSCKRGINFWVQLMGCYGDYYGDSAEPPAAAAFNDVRLRWGIFIAA